MGHILDTLSTGSDVPFDIDDAYEAWERKLASVLWCSIANHVEAAAYSLADEGFDVAWDGGESAFSVPLSNAPRIQADAEERAGFLDGDDQSQSFAWRMTNAVTALSGALAYSLLPTGNDFACNDIRESLGEAYCSRQ